MTGHKGDSEFCFPETLNDPRGEAEGNIEVERKQNSLFPALSKSHDNSLSSQLTKNIDTTKVSLASSNA